MKEKGDNTYKIPHIGKNTLEREGKLPDCCNILAIKEQPESF